VFLQHWGATADEIAGDVVGDHLCPDARLVATRSITLAAAPTDVFPWLRQMGFGRAGWYSYDWIDNRGRASATTIRPEWQGADSGDTVPGGPIDFEAAIVEPPNAFVLRLSSTGNASTRMSFTLAYDLREVPSGTRLVTRVRARIDIPGGRLLERFVLGPGDGVMLRRQLRGVAKRVGDRVS
jgi:hypothetical protein